MTNSDQLVWYLLPIGIAVLVFLGAIVLEYGGKKNPAIKKLESVLKNGAFLSSTVISIAIGFILVLGGYYGYLFSSAFTFDDSLYQTIIRIAELVIGASLILGIFTRFMTVGLLALFSAGFFFFPALNMLDYVIFAGLAIFLFLVHRDTLSFTFFFQPATGKGLFDHYRKYALPILKFTAGLGIVFVAFHHTILDTSSSMEFLTQKPILNFMQSLFSVDVATHEFFLFYGGVLTMLIGLLLTFGLIERIAASIIAIGVVIGFVVSGFGNIAISIAYITVLYIVITGNQFEEREKVAKG